MMKRSLVIFLALLGAISTPVVAHADPSAAGPDDSGRPCRVLFLGNNMLPPMSYQHNGEQIGVIPDLADAIKDRMKQDVQIQFMNWSEAQHLVLEDKADALLHINPSPERKKVFDFSEPLLASEFSIFTRSDRTEIYDISHLKGLNVGVEPKGLSIDKLKKHPEINLVVVPDVIDGFQQLSRGDIDAVVVDKWVGAYVAAELRLQNIRISGQAIDKGYSRIAVKKGRSELLASINDALLEIKDDGTYAEILSRWGPKEVVFQTKAQHRKQKQIFAFILSLLVIVLFFGIISVLEVRRRVEFEKKLMESGKLFKAVFEQAGGYCMILQPTDTGIPVILDANEAACRSHGYTKEEMIGRPVADLDDEEGKQLCRERTQLILSGKPFAVENIHVRKDGSTFPVEVFANRVDFKDRPSLIVTTEFDISERRTAAAERQRLEKQLLQAQKMESIGNLAGGIAHDFNNILSSIIGYTELALDDTAKGTPLEDNLQEVYKAGMRARELVKQILAFARRSDGERKPVPVGAVVTEALKLIRPAIPSTIEVKKTIESQSLVMADPSQVQRIIMNLCTNAAQAMEESGGILDVRLTDVRHTDPSASRLGVASGDFIELVVSDTGRGMSPDVVDSIFEPYFTTKGVGEGTGMGLAMVHGIVESYGGGIKVESEPGKGTAFSVYLPTTINSAPQRQHIEEALPSGSGHILFVDDELSIAKMGRHLLERLGYQVTARTSSVEALKLFRSRPDDFDLVITDMTMPNMTGDELAMELIACRPNIPIILCTGYSKKISEEKATAIGIKAFAIKPMVKADLAKVVRRVLNEKG